MDDILTRTMHALRAAQSAEHRASATIPQIAKFGVTAEEALAGVRIAREAGLVEPRQHSRISEVRWAITRRGHEWLRGVPEARPIRVRLDGADHELVFNQAPTVGYITVEVNDGVEKVGETVLTDVEVRSLMRMAGL